MSLCVNIQSEKLKIKIFSNKKIGFRPDAMIKNANKNAIVREEFLEVSIF
jgi:hypothetical protein